MDGGGGADGSAGLNNVRLPDDTQRLAVVGKTGSGKTHAAAWHLSRRSFDQMPWVIYDFKVDPLINSIYKAERIGLDDPVPHQPGIYIVNPLPDDGAAVEKHLWKVWERENIGVYIDEGYMIDNAALRATLTQGRSKHIPMIVLSQRPTWITRFLFSEADFFQVFFLNDERDRKTVGAFIPSKVMERRLPDFHSYYYDVGRDDLAVMKPVPGRADILQTFEDRMRVKTFRRI
jgi:hypothetical protein